MKKFLLIIFAISLLAASCNFSDTAKVGIVKTANGGVDWQGANRIVNTDKSLLERSISMLRYNTAGDRLYASSYNGGLFSSDDAGENWTEVLGSVPLYDFAFDPFDDQVIYAAAYLSERGRVFKTADGGKSWNEIYSDAGEENPVRAIGINPLNPSEILIGTGKGSVILSSDGGASWQLAFNLRERINRIYWTESTLYIVGKETGLYESSNGGGSFEHLTDKIRVNRRDSEVFLYSSRPNDYRQLAINPNNPENLYLTTNLGVFESNNGGSSWNYVNMPFRQQDASPFAIAFAQTGEEVIYASIGEVILKTTDGGSSWTSSDTGTNGLVTTIVVSRNLAQIAFAGVSQ